MNEAALMLLRQAAVKRAGPVRERLVAEAMAALGLIHNTPNDITNWLYTLPKYNKCMRSALRSSA